MAIIAPFKGLTYNFDTVNDLSKVVAPPYDVISEDEQEAFYQADPYNVIRLILGKKKMGDSDWDNRYTRSADVFKHWESEDILVRTDRPAIYITSMTFNPGDGGAQRTRWGLIALVRIEEEDSGVILPHERTFSAHREDRLKLMKACSAQFSQIFALYEDSENRVGGFLEGVIKASPEIFFDFKDGTSHQMWTVQNQSIIRQVSEALREKSIFIADGHHRYETARNYRNAMRARYEHRPSERSYEYVMMYLTNMDDAGLTILPSHRLIKECTGFQLAPFIEKLKQWFEITVLPSGDMHHENDLQVLKARLDENSGTTSAIGFRLQGEDRTFLFQLKAGMRDKMGEDLDPSLKKLDVLVLSRLVLQEAMGLTKEDMDNEEKFHYESDMLEALSMVDSRAYQMVFFLNPTKIEQVKEVASDSLVMPRKSTYFYPKTLTGLVFNRIDPHEIIQVPKT
jgi:uncharacterized protein (DUF1015 family)